MFKSVKMPKNLCEYRLFRGAADFGNLEQWDLYETGYSFLNVITVPVFLDTLARVGTTAVSKDIAAKLLNNFVYIMEHEFRGLSGLSGITTETNTITDGISELQVINKVVEDTSVTVTMKFFEKSGRALTKFAELYVRGIKDSRTQGKHYWGLIENGTLSAGFENEVFSFLYYITDNTYRTVETAVLLMCAQIKEVPMDDIYNVEKGTYTTPEIDLQFNCFPVINDDISEEAARLLEYLLSDAAGNDRLIIDTMSAKDFYHVGGKSKTIKQAASDAYGLRASAGSGGYAGGAGTSKYNSDTYASKVDAKRTSGIYG